MLRCRIDWNDPEETEILVSGRWRRIAGRRVAQPRGWGDIHVLSPQESTVLVAETVDWEDRVAKLRRCSQRPLVMSMVFRTRLLTAAVFTDRNALSRVKGEARAVPAMLALAALSQWMPGRTVSRLGWADGRHSAEVWARKGRWCPTPVDLVRSGSCVIRPGRQPDFASSSVPCLSPREWLAVGSALCRTDRGTYPVRTRPKVLAKAGWGLLATSIAGSTLVAVKSEQRYRLAMEELVEAQRVFETAQLRSQRGGGSDGS